MIKLKDIFEDRKSFTQMYKEIAAKEGNPKKDREEAEDLRKAVALKTKIELSK